MISKNNPVSTTLRPPWLGITRAAWIVLSTAAFGLTVLSIINAPGSPLPQCTPAGAVCGPWTLSQEDLAVGQQAGIPLQIIRTVYYVSSLFPKAAFLLVALLIFWRRSQDWVAQVFSLMLTLFLVEGISNLGSLQFLADILYGMGNFIFGIMLLVFPNGRFAPRWIGWLAIPLALAQTISVFSPQLHIAINEGTFATLLLSALLLWFAITAYSVIYRYRFVSTPAERQQIKWALGGVLSSIILFIPFTIITVTYPPSRPSVARLLFMLLVFFPIYMAAYLFVPGGIAFAILRYRLWDIDLIIRRTLTYTVLTALLAAVYLGGVVVLQGILGPLVGQARSPVVIVITTLGIATLFNPLRQRVQDFIDRRFYRRKYISEQALMSFAETARYEVDVDTLSEALLRVVDETVQPRSIWLWLNRRPTQSSIPESKK